VVYLCVLCVRELCSATRRCRSSVWPTYQRPVDSLSRTQTKKGNLPERDPFER